MVTFSGAIGSRRSELSSRVAAELHWPRVKFSKYIEKVIEGDGELVSRSTLQSYGQELVQHRLEEFIEGVLAEAPGWAESGGDLIVDGLRHTEVLLTLRRQVHPSKVVYIHVTADPNRREEGARERGIEEDMLYRYDRNLTEAQLPAILPAYADMVVDGALGFSVNVKKIVDFIELLGGARHGD